MRITENELRRIIREVISEDLNEGFIGDFIDAKFGEKYLGYRMLVKLSKKLSKYIKDGEEQLGYDRKPVFSNVNLNVPRSGFLEGFLNMNFDSHDTGKSYKICSGSYKYEVSSKIEENEELVITFKFVSLKCSGDNTFSASKYNSWAKDFFVNVPFKIGNKFLSRPDFNFEEIVYIVDEIRNSFFNVMRQD